MQSLDAADQICASAAAAGPWPGHFRAWLSTSTTNAIDRLGTASGWIRTDGAPFADTRADLISGRIHNPIDRDELGMRVSDRVLTGTSAAGRGSVDPMFDCGDWSDDGSGTAIAGTTDGTTGVWSYATKIHCDQPARLYCFGVDLVASVPQQKTRGAKLAFLSDTPFTVGGGLPAADAQCATEAQTAGLSGTFRALVATTTATAMSRVQANVNQGAVWARLDGVALNGGQANAFVEAGGMLAPLNVTSGMRYLDAIVFTGAAAPNVLGSDAETCGDWVGGQNGSVGRASDMASWFANGASAACTGETPVEIYCFQAD
jgi:hypothetical protein